MAELRHALPGVSAAGFIVERELRKAALNLSAIEFVATYGAPALVIAALRSVRIRLKETKSPTDSTTTGKWGGFKYDKRIAFIAKRPGNPFPRRVTVGRAPQNDIVIDLPTISKFHAFFEHEGDRWLLVSLASVNGTYVNDETLAPNDILALAAGDVVRFGAELEGVFLLPGSLHARLTGGRNGPLE
jgi:hypothetical protein